VRARIDGEHVGTQRAAHGGWARRDGAERAQLWPAGADATDLVRVRVRVMVRVRVRVRSRVRDRSRVRVRVRVRVRAEAADVHGREEAAEVAPAHPEGALPRAVGLQLPA